MDNYKSRYLKREHERAESGSYRERFLARQIQSGKINLEEIGKQIVGQMDAYLQNHNNYLQNYNTRFGNRKGDYTDSYVSDYQDYLDKVDQQAKNFDTESNAIKGVLDYYGSYLDQDWVAEIEKVLDDAKTQQGEIRNIAAQDVSYWSQFEDEAAYKGAQQYDAQSKADLPQLYNELEAFRAQVDNLSEMENEMYMFFGKPDIDVKSQARARELQKQIAEATAQWGGLEGMKDALSEKEEFYNGAQAIQKEAEQRKADLPKLSMELEDFRTQIEVARQIHAQIAAFNPYAYGDEALEVEAALKAQLAQITEPWGGMQGMEAAFSEKEAYYKTAKRYQDWDKLGAVVDNADFEIMSAPPVVDDDWYNTENDVYDRFVNMTDTEKAIYNYHYNTGGEDVAEEYYDSITERLNHRQAKLEFKEMKGDTLAEVFFGVRAGLDQFGSGMKGLWNSVTGNDDYVPTSTTQYLAGMARGDLADDGFKVFGSSLGQMAYDFLSTTANMAPSIAASIGVGLVSKTAGAAVGAGLLGAGAAGNAYTEMINEGYSKTQAGNYATMIGLSEAGLSYLLGGISSLGGKVSGNVIGKIVDKVDNVISRVAIKLGGTMLSEGMEEGLQEVLTPWFKQIATNIQQEKADWEEVAYASLLGAVTGLVMEGPGVAVDAARTSITGKNLQNKGVTAQDLAAIGSEFDPQSAQHQLAQRVIEQEASGEKVSAYTMGRMWREFGAEMSKENTAVLTQALQERGMSEQQAKNLAGAFTNLTAGKKLTKAQQAAMENSQDLAAAVREVLINPDTQAGRRMQAYNAVREKLKPKTKEPSKTAAKAEAKVSTDGKTHFAESGVVCSKRLLNQVVGKSLRTHNLKS